MNSTVASNSTRHPGIRAGPGAKSGPFLGPVSRRPLPPAATAARRGRALLGACLAQRTDFVWLYLLRGFAQEELQAWDAAESDFQKASQMPLDENTRYVLLVYRAVLRIRTDRSPEAIADLQAAIKLKPNAYQAFVNMANAFRKLGDLDQAVAQLDHALRLEPGLAHLYRLRARLQLQRNEPERALGDFNQAIERETSNSTYRVDDLVDRGRLLLRGKKHDEALASFNAALTLRPDHLEARRFQAEALFHLGRFAEVVEVFDRYLDAGKPSESVYRGRGLARAELGRYPGAIEDFTKALELKPTSAVQAYRGWMHLAVDAPKMALRDFELAIELDPRNGDAYSGRGFVHVSQGRHREAARDAAEAIRLGPSSPRLFYNAARIYAQCPEPNRAARGGVDPAGDALAPPGSTGRVLVQEYPQGPGPRHGASTPLPHPVGNHVAAEELTHGLAIADRGSMWPPSWTIAFGVAGDRAARASHPARPLPIGPGVTPEFQLSRCGRDLARSVHASRGRSLLNDAPGRRHDPTRTSTPRRPAVGWPVSCASSTRTARRWRWTTRKGATPTLTFQAATAGTYYLGVSSAPNDNYNPTVAVSGRPW